MSYAGIAIMNTYIATYDVSLVVLSIIIAFIASYTALNLAGRSQSSRSVQKLFGRGAIAMGVGIWSMHFIGMLAYQLPLDGHIQLLISMVAADSGLALSGRASADGMATVGAWKHFLGLGIASHRHGCYAGGGYAYTRPDWLSDAIAICVSLVALWLAFHLRAETTN